MDYLVYFGFLFFSIILGLIICFLSRILRYKSKKNIQNQPSASHNESLENIDTRFKINFLPHCICFLLFGAQCALIFPFAYQGRSLDAFYAAEIMIFILILIITLLFSIKSEFTKYD